MNMTHRFRLEAWAAVAAGLSTPADWQAWFRDPVPPDAAFVPDNATVPAALRRRLAPLGRAALSVAAAVRPDSPCPMVFLSRHGELRQTAELLTQLATEGAVSPMGFSLSVHNAIAGIYGIAHADRVATTCIAANEDLAESGVVEALGWLSSGCEHVMLVCAEDPVPHPYAGDADEATFRHAWACRLAAGREGDLSLEVHRSSAPTPAAHGVPPSLRALAFMAGAMPGVPRLETGRYRWQRHA